MDTSSHEISSLTRKIFRACSNSQTRRCQCLALFYRCSQIDAYLLAWRSTGSTRAAPAISQLVSCFRQSLALIQASASDNWLQHSIARLDGEYEFQRIFEDLEILVDMIASQLVFPLPSREAVLTEDELREAARRDRAELTAKLRDIIKIPHPEKVAVAENLLQRLRKSEQMNELTTDPRGVVREDFLGSGASGRVYRGRWLGHPVAVKVFDRDDLTFEKEVQAMSKVVRPHPHVLQMFCFARTQHEQMIVMELMKMDLKKFLDRRSSGTEGGLPIIAAVDILLQIARGTRHLHEHQIVHRDLKPQNVLVDFDEADQENVRVLLTDFGISRTEFDSLSSGELTRPRGTLLYMAPEMFPSEAEMPRYTRKVDVFSFAMLSSEVLTGSPPYGQEYLDMRRMKAMLKAGWRPKLPKNCPGELVELINRCWDSDSDKRPTFVEIESELLKIKKQLLLPLPPEAVNVPVLTRLSISSSSEGSFSFATAERSLSQGIAPGVDELTIWGTVEVGCTLKINFRPKNGAKYFIGRWLRKGDSGISSEVQKPVMVICSGGSQCVSSEKLDLALTAADFQKTLEFHCLPLNGSFESGQLDRASTGIVGFRGVEAIRASWEGGQAQFKVVRLQPNCWESTGKLFINRRDWFLWWGHGNPQNLRIPFAEDDPLELCDEGPLVCNLRKSDGTYCMVKFTSSSSRDNAVLTMNYFWGRRGEPS